MSRKGTKSTRAERWPVIVRLDRPAPNEIGGKDGNRRHEIAHAVIEAMHKINRVVRASPAKFGEGIEFRVRRG